MSRPGGPADGAWFSDFFCSLALLCGLSMFRDGRSGEQSGLRARLFSANARLGMVQGSEESSLSENRGRVECDIEGENKHQDTDWNSTRNTYGVVYTLTKSEIDNVDYYEGGYVKTTMDIQMLPPPPGVTAVTSASSLSCLVYISINTSPGKIQEEYIGRINRGLRDASIPSAWVDRVVRKWVPARVGVEEERDNVTEKERALSQAWTTKNWEPTDVSVD